MRQAVGADDAGGRRHGAVDPDYLTMRTVQQSGTDQSRSGATAPAHSWRMRRHAGVRALLKVSLPDAIDPPLKHGIYGTANRADVQLFATLRVFDPAMAVSDLPNPLGSDWLFRAVAPPNWPARPVSVTDLVTGRTRKVPLLGQKGHLTCGFYSSGGRI